MIYQAFCVHFSILGIENHTFHWMHGGGYVNVLTLRNLHLTGLRRGGLEGRSHFHRVT